MSDPDMDNLTNPFSPDALANTNGFERYTCLSCFFTVPEGSDLIKSNLPTPKSHADNGSWNRPSSQSDHPRRYRGSWGTGEQISGMSEPPQRIHHDHRPLTFDTTHQESSQHRDIRPQQEIKVLFQLAMHSTSNNELLPMENATRTQFTIQDPTEPIWGRANDFSHYDLYETEPDAFENVLRFEAYDDRVPIRSTEEPPATGIMRWRTLDVSRNSLESYRSLQIEDNQVIRVTRLFRRRRVTILYSNFHPQQQTYVPDFNRANEYHLLTNRSFGNALEDFLDQYQIEDRYYLRLGWSNSTQPQPLIQTEWHTIPNPWLITPDSAGIEQDHTVLHLLPGQISEFGNVHCPFPPVNHDRHTNADDRHFSTRPDAAPYGDDPNDEDSSSHTNDAHMDNVEQFNTWTQQQRNTDRVRWSSDDSTLFHTTGTNTGRIFAFPNQHSYDPEDPQVFIATDAGGFHSIPIRQLHPHYSPCSTSFKRPSIDTATGCYPQWTITSPSPEPPGSAAAPLFRRIINRFARSSGEPWIHQSSGPSTLRDDIARLELSERIVNNSCSHLRYRYNKLTTHLMVPITARRVRITGNCEARDLPRLRTNVGTLHAFHDRTTYLIEDDDPHILVNMDLGGIHSLPISRLSPHYGLPYDLTDVTSRTKLCFCIPAHKPPPDAPTLVTFQQTLTDMAHEVGRHLLPTNESQAQALSQAYERFTPTFVPATASSSSSASSSLPELSRRHSSSSSEASIAYSDGSSTASNVTNEDYSADWVLCTPLSHTSPSSPADAINPAPRFHSLFALFQDPYYEGVIMSHEPMSYLPRYTSPRPYITLSEFLRPPGYHTLIPQHQPCSVCWGPHHKSQCTEIRSPRSSPLVIDQEVYIGGIDPLMSAISNIHDALTPPTYRRLGRVIGLPSNGRGPYIVHIASTSTIHRLPRHTLSAKPIDETSETYKPPLSFLAIANDLPSHGNLSHSLSDRITVIDLDQDLSRYNGETGMIHHEYSPLLRCYGIKLDRFDGIFAVLPANIISTSPTNTPTVSTSPAVIPTQENCNGNVNTTSLYSSHSAFTTSCSPSNVPITPPTTTSPNECIYYTNEDDHLFTEKRSGPARIHPRRRPPRPATDFRMWLPDSGASSHFTNDAADLFDIEPCSIKVTVADGTTVLSTKLGKSRIIFPTDQGKRHNHILKRVLFVPGLNLRLFSFEAFLTNPLHSVHCTNGFYQLDFGHGSTYTVPASSLPRGSINTTTTTQGSNIPKNKAPSTITADDDKRPRLNLELVQRRFGGRAIKSLLAGSFHRAWSDYRLTAGPDDYFEGCRISISRSAPRSKRGPNPATHPFERLFMDIIPAPANSGLTRDTAFPSFLLVVDHYSRLTWIGGMHDRSTSEVIRCLRLFLVETRSQGRTKAIDYIRGDADSSFLSAEFQSWAIDSNISVSFAAPKHQEQNSICESAWRTLNDIARTMRVTARLGLHFFYHSCRYASHCLNRLPAKGLVNANDDPTTPHFLAFGTKPRLGNIRVFGCPVSFKRYNPQTPSGRLTKKQQDQRATSRGIFIGMPQKQAGYLIYLEDRIGTAHLIVSQDVYFDEDFRSAVATTVQPFQGAQFLRPAGERTLKNRLTDDSLEYTGSVDDVYHPNAISAKGEDILEPPSPDPDAFYGIDSIINHKQITGGHFRFVIRWQSGEITEEPAKYLRSDIPEEFIEYLRKKKLTKHSRFAWARPDAEQDDASTASSNQDDANDLQQPISPPRYNLRSRESAFTVFKSNQDLFVSEPDPIQTAFAAIHTNTKGHPVSMFLPEPQTLKAVLDSPPEIRSLWEKAMKDEIQNLVNNDTFRFETPKPGEQVLPTKLVYKAKSTAEGSLEKLKARCVARGDLQKGQEWEDTWSACASIRTVKVFLALAASLKRRVKQGDFVGAYLQAKVRGRVFIRLDPRMKDLFPDLAKYFGPPLRLNKGIYGLTFSGKFWNEEYTEWLINQGFVQSTADTTYFIKYYQDGSWVRLIFYVDDLLYFGSNKEAETCFEKAVANRFRIDFNGSAQWFLQMRIHQYEDFSYSIDQYRYAKNVLAKFCPKDAPFGVPKHRKTPAPIDYVFTKENRPSEEQQKQLTIDYRGLDFRSAVCSLLYLAISTRGDILFIVNKLAKACLNPGRKDFEALLHLFGYLRAEPAWGSKFYAQPEESPVNTILRKHKVPKTELVVFTDASWQDCPDTGRSTSGFLIFYRGGVIEASSTLQIPVAMSSCEAEVMSACSGSMAASHVHMLLYDMKYLGTKQYNEKQLALPNPPTVIMVDNESACKMSLSDKLTKHTRHISRRYHYMREGYKLGVHRLHWCPGEDMLSDAQTKTQESTKINPQRDRSYYKLPSFLWK